MNCFQNSRFGLVFFCVANLLFYTVLQCDCLFHFLSSGDIIDFQISRSETNKGNGFLDFSWLQKYHPTYKLEETEEEVKEDEEVIIYP